MMNNLSRQILFLLVCLTFSLHTYGQLLRGGPVRLKDNHEMARQDIYTLHFMGMTYAPPEDGFIGIYGYFGHKPDRRFVSFSSSIESEDNTFAVLFYIPSIISERDTLTPVTYEGKPLFRGTNSSHIFKLREPEVKSIRYYPSEEAVQKFNADTAIVIYMKMYRYIFYEDRLLGKYRKCRGVLLQKNDKGYIIMYCLYNDEKHWRKNEKLVESLFRFK